jgi:hypothetical protein
MVVITTMTHFVDQSPGSNLCRRLLPLSPCQIAEQPTAPPPSSGSPGTADLPDEATAPPHCAAHGSLRAPARLRPLLLRCQRCLEALAATSVVRKEKQETMVEAAAASQEQQQQQQQQYLGQGYSAGLLLVSSCVAAATTAAVAPLQLEAMKLQYCCYCCAAACCCCEKCQGLGQFPPIAQQHATTGRSAPPLQPDHCCCCYSILRLFRLT